MLIRKRPGKVHSEEIPAGAPNLPQVLPTTNSGCVIESLDEIKTVYHEAPTQDTIEPHPTKIHISNPRYIRRGSGTRQRNGTDIQKQRVSTEKTTFILVVIVVLFAITHSNRLALKMYMTVMPEYNSLENFTKCLLLGR